MVGVVWELVVKFVAVGYGGEGGEVGGGVVVVRGQSDPSKYTTPKDKP